MAIGTAWNMIMSCEAVRLDSHTCIYLNKLLRKLRRSSIHTVAANLGICLMMLSVHTHLITWLPLNVRLPFISSLTDHRATIRILE